MPQMSHQEVSNRFGYHRPPEAVQATMEDVRSYFAKFAEVIDKAMPPGRESSLAITNLEQCHFWVNAAIARNTPLTADPLDRRRRLPDN